MNLLNLQPGWDSYGASPVDPASVERAVALLAPFTTDEIPAPAVVPTVRGGLQLEWHDKAIDLEIELEASGIRSVTYEDPDGEVVLEGAVDVSRLDSLIRRLAIEP